MGYAMDEETAITRLESGVWSAHVSDQWSIGENPNGGYLSAIVLRAFRELSEHQDPISITTHFLRPGMGDAPAEIHAELIRSGRSVSSLRGTLVQDGKTRLEVIAALGDLADAGDAPSWTISAPDIAPPDQCVPRDGSRQGVALPLMNRVEILLPVGREVGGHGDAETVGWIRFRDGRPPDSLAALFFADAFPPSIFGRLGMVGWVPTVEMTIHIRRRPAPGWVLGQFRTGDLVAGRLIEDGALWDSDGQLIAQIRQIGMLLT